MNVFSRSCLILACVAIIDTSQAHHGITDDLDLGNFIDIVGRLESISWLNPHVILRVNVESDITANQQWIVLADAPASLLSRGLHPNGHSIFSDYIQIRVYPTKASLCGGICEGYGYELTDSQGKKYVLHKDLYETVNQLN